MSPSSKEIIYLNRPCSSWTIFSARFPASPSAARAVSSTAPRRIHEAQGSACGASGRGRESRLVLVDGSYAAMGDGYGGWLYWGEVPLENIERVEVVRGAKCGLWGNFAMGGVINVVTETPG